MDNILEIAGRLQLENRTKFGIQQMRSHIKYKNGIYFLYEYDKETCSIKIDVVPSEYFGTIGSRIKALREEHQLSQKELSEKTGVPQPSISLYEQDKLSPSAKSLISLANELFTTTDYLLTGIW